MRAIRALEPADVDSAASARAAAWGARHRVALLGLVVALASAGWLVYVVLGTRPTSPGDSITTGDIARGIDSLTLDQTFAMWASFQRDLARDDPRFVVYRKQLGEYQIRLGIAVAFLAVGLLILASSWLIPASAATREETPDSSEPIDAAAP